MADQPCPCHSGMPYSACCERYHHGALPESALVLMRSRYAAYALGLVDYIINTTRWRGKGHVPETEQWRPSILEFSTVTTFCGLKVLAHTEGRSEAVVKFTAVLKQGERDVSFTETSRFVKENGQWFYIQNT